MVEGSGGAQSWGWGVGTRGIMLVAEVGKRLCGERLGRGCGKRLGRGCGKKLGRGWEQGSGWEEVGTG